MCEKMNIWLSFFLVKLVRTCVLYEQQEIGFCWAIRRSSSLVVDFVLQCFCLISMYIYPPEEFLTPPSTPPSEEAESTDGLSQAVDSSLVSKALNTARDRYDR